MFAFGLAGAAAGLYEETIPFILVLVPLMVSMGFDSMVGLMVVHFAVASGASTPFLNPFNLGVGQALAEGNYTDVQSLLDEAVEGITQPVTN